MRLLNTKTHVLEHFAGGFDASRTIPHYAILSHTWGEEEITFEDVTGQNGVSLEDLKAKKAFAKVQGSCDLAAKHGYDYIWIDTCCIDKTSSAELSEAINSMFDWYMYSEVCFAYLADATHGSSISDCRWFRRGWTLQELIAPSVVSFYDKDWTFLGNSFSMAAELSGITGIDERVFRKNRSQTAPNQDESLASMSTDYYVMYPSSRVEKVARETINSFSVAQIMHWASSRETTIKEDMAYSLMGIFEVNMTLMYGEGDRAFTRLQEKIIKRSNDHSILAHRDHKALPNIQTIATSASAFVDAFLVERTSFEMSLSNRRLTAYLLICPLTQPSIGGATHIAILDCYGTTDLLSRPAIPLLAVPGNEATFWRPSEALFLVEAASPGRAYTLLEDTSDPYAFMINPTITYFNVPDTQRKRITLLLDRPPQLSDNNANMMPPLQIKLIHKSEGMEEYTLDKSYPQRTGNFFLSMPNSRPIGIASFHSPSNPSFLVTWGKSLWKRPTGSDNDNLLWCKISPLDAGHPSASSFMSAATAPAGLGPPILGSRNFRDRSDSIVSRVWREGLDLDNTWSSRDLNSMPEEERQRDTAVVGQHRIRARIKMKSFLERTIAELEVLVSDVE